METDYKTILMSLILGALFVFGVQTLLITTSIQWLEKAEQIDIRLFEAECDTMY